MNGKTWRVMGEDGTRDVVVEYRGYVGDGRSQYAVSGVYIVDVSERMAVTRWCAMEAHALPVREILAPGELSAEERVAAAIRSYGRVLTETRGSLAEACDAAVAAERSRIRTACDAIRDRALAEAEREVRDLDEGLGPLDIRDSAVLKLAGTQHYALACGAIECADAIGYGAK